MRRSERARAADRAARVLDLEPGALARRAHALWRFAHPAAIARLADDARVVLTGPSAASRYGAALIGPGPLELYVRDSDVPIIDREYGLLASDASEANVLLRVPNDLWPFEPGERVVPSVVLAADMIDRGDERSVRSGRALLRRAQTARA